MARYIGQDVLGRARSRQRERQQAAERAMFAELLAEGVKTDEAARQLGRTAQWGRNMLARMRRELGPQAV